MVRGQGTPAMDDSPEAITGRVRALRKRAGYTLVALAKAMGFRGASSLQRYESPNDYAGGYLKRELVGQLEKALIGRGAPPISREEVWELAGPEFTITRKEPVNATIHGKTTGPGARIALYGQAVGGLDGEFVLNEGNKLADITAPPALASVSGAYAVSCSGDSMEPRYFDGEVCYVHPKRRPVRGDFVVAQIHNPNDSNPPLAYIKRLVRYSEGGLVLEQFNPPKELRFERTQVISLHVIVASGDRLLENW
jgi:transcriptional regulator with XRE-family HTH domain